MCTSCHELAAFLPCVDMLTIICCQMLRHHISLSSTPQKTPVVPACKAYVTHSRPRCCYRKAESQCSAVNERMNVSQPECYHRRCMIDTHCLSDQAQRVMPSDLAQSVMHRCQTHCVTWCNFMSRRSFPLVAKQLHAWRSSSCMHDTAVSP